MKSFLKYPVIFLAAFFAAGGIAYFAVTLFTKSAQVIVMPKLTGKNILYVLETLTNMGLNARLYGTSFDETIPRYAVISQDPAPGSPIKKGRDVIIYISKGKKENIMPDLRQISVSDALITLERMEFKKGALSYAFSSDTVENSIISQYPEPFSSTLKGTACNLLISKGVKPVKLFMPDFTGLTMAGALKKADHLDLAVSKIKSKTRTQLPAGIVLSQTPSFGTFITRQSPIALIVNNATGNKELDPDIFNRLTLVLYRMEPGFINRHVRVETDIFGPVLKLYDEYLPAGKDISLLLPSGEKGFVRIFIDDKLKKNIMIDPWKQGQPTGDISWELSPLQSYLQISPDWEMN